MELEKLLDSIKTEFTKEIDKRNELLDKVAKLQKDNEQLEQDLKFYRSIFTMNQDVCAKCMFNGECISAGRVDGKELCSSFHAKLERKK